jgi:hypothetical protein
MVRAFGREQADTTGGADVISCVRAMTHHLGAFPAREDERQQSGPAAGDRACHLSQHP